MFQNLPLPVPQEVHDSSGVTPCIVMKNDGVLYQQVLSFFLEFMQFNLFAKVNEPLLRGTQYNTRDELIMLKEGQYRTSRNMDVLMVYDAFQTFGKRCKPVIWSARLVATAGTAIHPLLSSHTTSSILQHQLISLLDFTYYLPTMTSAPAHDMTLSYQCLPIELHSIHPSFTATVSRSWNSLPSSLRNCQNISQFKASLFRHAIINSPFL